MKVTSRTIRQSCAIGTLSALTLFYLSSGSINYGQATNWIIMGILILSALVHAASVESRTANEALSAALNYGVVMSVMAIIGLYQFENSLLIMLGVGALVACILGLRYLEPDYFEPPHNRFDVVALFVTVPMLAATVIMSLGAINSDILMSELMLLFTVPMGFVSLCLVCANVAVLTARSSRAGKAKK